MSSGSSWKSGVAAVITLGVVGAAGVWWIQRHGGAAGAEPPKANPPAVQAQTVKEGELNVLTLTPEAETRLGLAIEPVKSERRARVRRLGGEVVLPPGRAVVVSAPFAGTVKIDAASAATPGRALEPRHVVLTLEPLLTNEARTSLQTTLATARVDAEGQVRNAEVQVSAAEVARKRAEQLLADEAGSRRAVDEAVAAYDLAVKMLDAARARRTFLADLLEGKGGSSTPPMPIESPMAGILRNVLVAGGQPVPAGAPLFEVMDLATVWVRVPVYVGELADLAPDRPAQIGPVGSNADTVEARPVPAPPSATAASATRDLYFELPNPHGRFAPGERVSAAVPLRGEEDALVVPWSAVVFDVNGGAWVYHNVAPHKFSRRRVEVSGVAGTDASARATLVGGGLPAGTPVVARGAAELFGREMGFAK